MLYYTSDLEVNGSTVIGPDEHKTSTRFKYVDDFESFESAINFDYDSEDVIFFGYVYKLKTPQFKVVKRSAYANCIDYKRKIVEYHGQNVYIPTSVFCFIKCINCFTNKDHTEEFRDIIEIEKYRSGITTSNRIQPFCKK